MDTIQLKDILPAWTPGTAIGHRNLTLVPLQGAGHQARFQDYLLASEAIDAGVLTVTEVDESGTVPELLAVNDADRPILLIDGEELQGAKQNRILNTSVLLPPKSKTRIPVSCVEEGRWSHVSPTFKAGNYAPSSLRQRKSRDVQRSLRARGRAESDQGAVWESVAAHIDARAAKSPTRAMSDAMATLGDVVGRYHEALPYPSATCGVVAAVWRWTPSTRPRRSRRCGVDWWPVTRWMPRPAQSRLRSHLPLRQPVSLLSTWPNSHVRHLVL